MTNKLYKNSKQKWEVSRIEKFPNLKTNNYGMEE